MGNPYIIGFIHILLLLSTFGPGVQLQVGRLMTWRKQLDG